MQKLLSLEIIGAASVSIAGIVVFDRMLSIMDGGGGGARSRRKARMLQFATLVFAVFLVFLGEFVVGQSSTYVRPPLAPAKSYAVEKLLQERKNMTASTDPDQMHVSLAGPGKMKVTWVTSSAVPATVQYGTTSRHYTNIASGVTKQYCFILYESGLIHDVILGPLKPSTTYFYKCGGFGAEFNFTTPPPSGPNVPIKFAVVGDLGQTDWTATTLEHLAGYDYDVLLFPGDLSYADTWQPLWDSFGQMMSPYANYRPWMVTEGNHEIEEIPLLVESFLSYNTRWEMPYNESGSSSNLYYSFEVAGVHILMLGSYADFDTNSTQFKWLQADLKKVDRTKTPWLIAILHAPWYNSNSAHQGEGDAMMAAMESILYAAKVDIMFAGHVHAYERAERAYLKKPDPCGILYITIGDGGNREGLAGTWLDPQPVWSVFRESSFGHGELEIFNATHAHWSWNRNQDVMPVVADDVWITSLSAAQSGCMSKSTTGAIQSQNVDDSNWEL